MNKPWQELRSNATRRLPAIFLAMIVAGCSSLIALAVPSHNQSLDVGDIPSGRYVLDPSHASLHFEVDHMGFSRFVGRFDTFSAEFKFDAEHPENSALAVDIEPASFNSGVIALDETLRGSAWLDTERYPRARFTAQSVAFQSETSGRILGQLELHGQTHPVAIDLVFNGGARDILRGTHVLGFSGTVTLSRSQWGLTALKTLVGDEVKMVIHAEFLWQKDPNS